jgi:hypothetical protein
MLPEESHAAIMYIAWDLAHKAEQESRTFSAKAWRAREDAEQAAEAARWRQKVAASPEITPEELKALEKAAKEAEAAHELARCAENETRLAMYECRKKFAEAKRLYVAQKEKPE